MQKFQTGLIIISQYKILQPGKLEGQKTKKKSKSGGPTYTYYTIMNMNMNPIYKYK